MSQTTKTGIFLSVAVGLMAAAVFASIPRSSTVDDFRDQGQLFFPEFRDPTLCASLEVVEVDPSTAEIRVFKVKQQADGSWVIPSHYDYPADAKDRLAKTAAQVMDLTKDTVRSSRSEDHSLLGVLDPLDMKSGDIEGLGKRISLKDRTDRVLAEYIIGKDVPNRPGQKFVRRPGQVRTYGVNLTAETSVQFADWIEPNLLDVQPASIRQTVFDNRKVDARLLKVLPGDIISIRRDADGAPWVLKGLPPDKVVNPTKTDALLKALADLKIVGVRPKPPELAAMLTQKPSQTIDQSLFRSLNSNGFYPTPAGMLSDEGTLVVVCDDGVMYKLQFGRVNYAKGEALSSGKGEEPINDEKNSTLADGKQKADGKDQAVESRFLFVTVTLDPSALPKPKEPEKSAPGELPTNVFSRTGMEIQEEQSRLDREIANWKKASELAQNKVDLLSKRFAPWYYLVPGNDYRSLLLNRDQLIRDKGPDVAPPPQGFNPGLPNRMRPMLPPTAPSEPSRR